MLTIPSVTSPTPLTTSTSTDTYYVGTILSSNTKVSDLKSLISDKLGIKRSEFYLSSNSKPLADSRLVSDY